MTTETAAPLTEKKLMPMIFPGWLLKAAMKFCAERTYRYALCSLFVDRAPESPGKPGRPCIRMAATDGRALAMVYLVPYEDTAVPEFVPFFLSREEVSALLARDTLEFSDGKFFVAKAQKKNEKPIRRYELIKIPVDGQFPKAQGVIDQVRNDPEILNVFASPALLARAVNLMDAINKRCGGDRGAKWFGGSNKGLPMSARMSAEVTWMHSSGAFLSASLECVVAIMPMSEGD